VATVLKSRNLNLLEPSGPVQACNWIALPLPLPFLYVSSFLTSFYHVQRMLTKTKVNNFLVYVVFYFFIITNKCEKQQKKQHGTCITIIEQFCYYDYVKFLVGAIRLCYPKQISNKIFLCSIGTQTIVYYQSIKLANFID
jgi:hypothetical protein